MAGRVDNPCVTVRETTAFVQTPVDVLSLLLRELRFESAAYRWLELGAPYRVGFDAVRPALRGVHIIARGTCELVLDDGSVTPLGAGDLVILPGGDGHELRSVPAPAVPVVSGIEVAMRTPGNRLRIGGPQWTRWWCAGRSSSVSPTIRRSAACRPSSTCPAAAAWDPTSTR
ncbi:hypothetical protein Vau01_067890 [Virgisporangium aurantiacum]|uniref:AraC-type transcription regulator ligand-binding domain-containing protein n=1 Tax=Virgisporangium aurantiacum TaxID=175570 RepID=A0A8J3ZDL0_9ACTN|nr:hypothetical protein Vau01_067890 [Virgisporangium aurantiacum]